MVRSFNAPPCCINTYWGSLKLSSTRHSEPPTSCPVTDVKRWRLLRGKLWPCWKFLMNVNVLPGQSRITCQHSSGREMLFDVFHISEISAVKHAWCTRIQISRISIGNLAADPFNNMWSCLVTLCEDLDVQLYDEHPDLSDDLGKAWKCYWGEFGVLYIALH